MSGSGEFNATQIEDEPHLYENNKRYVIAISLVGLLCFLLIFKSTRTRLRHISYYFIPNDDNESDEEIVVETQF